MSERPRRISSIPPRGSIPRRTLLNVARGNGITIRIGGGGLGNMRRRPQERPKAGEQDWSQEVAKHVFQKPGQDKAKPKPFYERDGEIGWEVEVVDDYDNRGGLGIVLEFAGIEQPAGTPFLRAKLNYGPDTTLFYLPVSYKKKSALLILDTTEDIFEAQVVPAKKDVDLFFQKELFLPQLATTHDPTSMTVRQNNGLIIVG